MFDKLFGRGKKKDESGAEPEIRFGRYSDNNKPLAKVNRWTDADNLFKEKKFGESLDAFFDYVKDDAAQNVVYERNGTEGRFQFFQGSKIIRGSFTEEQIRAEVELVRMPQPSVPVMRRLLEMNFNLYYSRFALDNEKLYMRFDSDTAAASPSKLYYGLKELAIKADKQDDLLVQDFAMLESSDSEQNTDIPLLEKEVKYEYLQKWIQQVLDTVNEIDADKYSGGISYTLLALVYRIDFLITPEGKLLNDLEKIAGIYFKKEERTVPDKNKEMVEAFKILKALPKEEIFKHLSSSKYTFAIVAPQLHKAVADTIHTANQNLVWYRDNKYPFIANQINEYGITYSQFSYSLPRAITELLQLYMMVNYADFFSALGYKKNYYDLQKKQFNTDEIVNRINKIQETWKEKYPNMDFKTENLRFESLVNFNLSFTNEIEFLNMEPK